MFQWGIDFGDAVTLTGTSTPWTAVRRAFDHPGPGRRGAGHAAADHRTAAPATSAGRLQCFVVNYPLRGVEINLGFLPGSWLWSMCCATERKSRVIRR